VRRKIELNLQKAYSLATPSFARELQELQQFQVPARLPEQHRQAVTQQYQQRIVQLQRMLDAPPPRVTLSYVDAVLEAVLTPWASSSTGTITQWAGSAAYPPPRELHMSLFQAGAPWNRAARSRRMEFVILGVGAGLSLLVLLPLSFAVLPVSRYRAKVRWSHIARVTVYSLTPPILIAACLVLVIAAGALFAGARSTAIDVAAFTATYAFVPVVITWWAAAIRHYLRMPHAWPVVVILSAMDSLIVLAALWLVVPEAALYMYELVVG
jgi:hypothetical protein